MDEPARGALFISHASPEDNAFTLWLGAKLTALGYTVFADVLRLKGGDDWERILEDAIRNKAAKVLLAATPHGVQKQGVRNEIAIATQTGKKIGDPNFIVPLRLAPFEAPLQIAQAQYVDFSKSWATGLSDLLELLTEKRLPFAWENGPSGSRQIVGRSDKRGFNWHFGVSCWARTVPVRHIRIAGRVIFTSDGSNPLGDARRLHRLRRSFCKSWRNDKWRDLLLAFWFWLSGGADFVDVPMGEGAVMRLKQPPMIFDADFGIEPIAGEPDGPDDNDENDAGVTPGDEGSDDDPEELD